MRSTDFIEFVYLNLIPDAYSLMAESMRTWMTRWRTWKGRKGLCSSISTAYHLIGGWWSKYSLYWFFSSWFSYFLWHNSWWKLRYKNENERKWEILLRVYTNYSFVPPSFLGVSICARSNEIIVQFAFCCISMSL